MKSLREFFLFVEADETATATKSNKKDKSKTKEGDKKPKSKAVPTSKKTAPKKQSPQKQPEPKKDSGPPSQYQKDFDADMAMIRKDKEAAKNKAPSGDASKKQDSPAAEPSSTGKSAKIPSLKSLTKSNDKPSPDLPNFKKQKEPKFGGHPEFTGPESPEDVGDEDIVPDDVPFAIKKTEPNASQHKKAFDADMGAIRKDKQKAKDSAARDKTSADDLKKLQNTPKPPPLPNSKTPSLGALSKRDTPADPKDPLAGLPKFADKDPNAEDPFAQPGVSPAPAKQGFLQKGADMLKKAGSAALSKGLTYGGLPDPKKPGMPSQAAMATGKDQAYGASPTAPEKMSLMKSLSKQRFGTDVFRDKTAGWKAGDIVDVGSLRGFKALQKTPKGWIVTRGRKEIYRYWWQFIPNGAIRH